ncbi:hypothetical protein K437DRAFT_295535 [Tilletiaria anomala UBC 951]|uniref:Uncharacterized protein n=1 Tax=Tilletiaria anomala (strain ATCC 24038 / CBS 436.72 / UBC 951) TaxID=1037660 RepID=A0A066VIV1_TILAU|nr:uncharacterized protein K437DRAFT_295535 [Tilletiaria anomala UBC 951]KDN41672.1 hypothetical protein K437DRAFT_295535 [Tilletiaria anomala UBC 951]
MSLHRSGMDCLLSAPPILQTCSLPANTLHLRLNLLLLNPGSIADDSETSLPAQHRISPFATPTPRVAPNPGPRYTACAPCGPCPSCLRLLERVVHSEDRLHRLPFSRVHRRVVLMGTCCRQCLSQGPTEGPRMALTSGPSTSPKACSALRRSIPNTSSSILRNTTAWYPTSTGPSCSLE